MGFWNAREWSARSFKCAGETARGRCNQLCADNWRITASHAVRYGVRLLSGHSFPMREFYVYCTDLLSEFPSLSGNTQPQYQNPGQAIWQRNVQQTPVQRPQQQQSQPLPVTQASQQPQSIQQRQDLSTQNNDDIFTGSTHLQNALDDYRHAGQGNAQVLGSRQPQTTNIDDFPPLGRNGTNETDPDQRSPFAAFPNSSTFPTQQSQIRQGLTSAPSSQTNDTRSSSVVDRHISPGTFTAAGNSRSPLENGRIGQFSSQDSGRDVRSQCEVVATAMFNHDLEFPVFAARQ